MKAIIILSKHAKARMSEREVKSFPTHNVRIYRDNFDNLKHYLNVSTVTKQGFLVLVKVGKNKFVVKTITKRGKIDDRNYSFFDRVVVQ